VTARHADLLQVIVARTRNSGRWLILDPRAGLTW
jgi:hypothetical protein